MAEVPARLDGLLAEAAATHPARIALVSGAERLTYAELDRRVSEVAQAIGPGPAVAVVSVLHPDFAIAYYAAARAGRIVAVVNPLLREEDLRHVLTTSGAGLVFADTVVHDRIEGVETVLIGGGRREGVRTLAELAGTPGPVPEVGADDDACLQFTSGTTGAPKAVRLSHRNLTVNAAQIVAAHRLDAESVTVNHLPTFHPMHLNSAVRAKATQVLCTGPEPVDAVAAANEHGATHLYSLPFRLARLAADPALDGLTLRTVQRIASGGSALPVSAAARLTERFGIPVFQGYGLAETSPLTHSDDPEHPVAGSVGKPVEHTECRVVDLETREVKAPGETGEVQLRGPQVMKGYLGGPDGTGLEPDGWLSTGDVGRIDADGRLFLVDRLKDVFKCDNFLIAPSEVEAVLNRHPLIAESVVVDLPDDFSGAVSGALLVLEPGADQAAVLAEVNEQLPYYQRVRDAAGVSSIPRSGNGKIQRRRLRDNLIAWLANPSTTKEVKTMFTVINTFTLKDPAAGAEFESRFLDHVGWMRRQDGFHSHQAVRAAERSSVYVNLGWWTSPEAFKRVLASETFQSHAKEFHQIVDVEADPSMGVLRIDGESTVEGQVVVERFEITGEPADFEAAYREYARVAAETEGFGHLDLAKSVMHPGRYTAAVRWAGPDAHLTAQDTPEHDALLAFAKVTTTVAEPVAGNRAETVAGRV
ncbi:AMP-binding protein [Amycolatopsis sp. NPDC059657]|uniref:AMP-binding protein n=1 Tax=Amycolatopsis sp. NPDC059657 TaxID=3346899 RepID=UPI00366F2639